MDARSDLQLLSSTSLRSTSLFPPSTLAPTDDQSLTDLAPHTRFTYTRSLAPTSSLITEASLNPNSTQHNTKQHVLRFLLDLPPRPLTRTLLPRSSSNSSSVHILPLAFHSLFDDQLISYLPLIRAFLQSPPPPSNSPAAGPTPPVSPPLSSLVQSDPSSPSRLNRSSLPVASLNVSHLCRLTLCVASVPF